MLGCGIPVAMHLILIDTPLGIVTTAPVVMETRFLKFVISRVPLTLLTRGGTKIKESTCYSMAITILIFLLSAVREVRYYTRSFSLPKFKVIDPHNVRDQQPGDSDCGRKPSQGASEHKI